MYQVKGKWALITGAARGIGYLTAKFMAEQGCNLILHSRDLRHTERVLDEVRFRGVSAVAVAADLNDLSAVERMLEEIDSIGVDVDIVMNNAGLQIAYRTDYCATPAEDYEISFRVNTIAPAMICYHFLPKMMAKGTGRILNTTSGIAEKNEETENNNSLVLLAEGGGGSILLTGDVEFPEESSLIHAGVIPQVDVIKIGNHGEGDATSAQLIATALPKLAVISTNSEDEPDTPDPRVVRLLAQQEIQILYTQDAAQGILVTLKNGTIETEIK